MTRAHLLLAALGVPLTALAAVLAPVWTYALSLAFFGLPHVLVELRYVDERFGARLRGRTVALLAIGLGGVAALRVFGVAGAGGVDGCAAAELLVGAGLMFLVVPVLARRSLAMAGLGAAACAVTAVGAVRAPIPTLVVLALAHNLTPVGFLAERLRGAARRSAMLACAIVFGAIPLAIASGLATELLLALGPTEGGPPGVGEVDLHLTAFVPPALAYEPWALDLFRAAAFLQCMHYAVVLHVLPRLGGASETAGSRLRWPPRGVFGLAVAALGALFVGGFALSFGDARAVYGVFAAVHAWVELPILLVALGVPPARALAAETV